MHEASARRVALVPRLQTSLEIGDAYAIAAWSAVFLGAYAGLRYAETGTETARGVNPGSFLHCLTFVVLARFALGDWDGALRAHAEMLEVAADDPRELPPTPYARGYACAALCHELRDEAAQADACLDLVRNVIVTRRPRVGLVGGCAAAARALAHRGRFEEVRELFPWTGRGEGSAPLLEALCEVSAAAEDWEDAEWTLRLARGEAEECRLLALPYFADRLEGRLAAAADRDSEASELLRRSAEGFRGLGAPWEEAWSRLQFAEAGREPEQAFAALATFERLGSVVDAFRPGDPEAAARRNRFDCSPETLVQLRLRADVQHDHVGRIGAGKRRQLVYEPVGGLQEPQRLSLAQAELGR